MQYSIQVNESPAVFEIKVPFKNVSTNATNCFVVMDGGQALVVDTGAPTEEGAEILAAALDELGVNRREAVYFLTHLHLDHAGLVDAIAPVGARVCVGRVDYDVVCASRVSTHFDDMRRLFLSQGASLDDALGFARYAVDFEIFDPGRVELDFMVEGDEIAVGSYLFRVMETPGHTPGHLVLFEPQSRIMFGGDHVLFVVSPGIALFPEGGDGLQAYLESLNKVRALQCSRLFVGHGEPRDDFAVRVDWLTQHHEQRLDEVVGIVAAEPGLTGDAIIRRIGWNVPHDSWESIGFMQRWLIETEGVAVLNHLVGCGRLTRELDSRDVFHYTCS